MSGLACVPAFALTVQFARQLLSLLASGFVSCQVHASLSAWWSIYASQQQARAFAVVHARQRCSAVAHAVGWSLDSPVLCCASLFCSVQDVCCSGCHVVWHRTCTVGALLGPWCKQQYMALNRVVSLVAVVSICWCAWRFEFQRVSVWRMPRSDMEENAAHRELM
jgi:hypothetical protein